MLTLFPQVVDWISIEFHDRLGRCLTRLFLGGSPDLFLAIDRQAIDEILRQHDGASFVHVHIDEQEEAGYRQARPGRPNARTPCQKETLRSFYFTWGMDPERVTEV